MTAEAAEAAETIEEQAATSTDATPDAVQDDASSANRSRLRRLMLATLVTYAIALVIGTHMPQEDGPPPLIPDKVLHFGAYLGLSWLLATTLHLYGRRMWPTMPALLLFGAVDEVTQIPVGRTADPLDWFADAAGILLGTAAAAFMAKRWPGPHASAAAASSDDATRP